MTKTLALTLSFALLAIGCTRSVVMAERAPVPDSDEVTSDAAPSDAASTRTANSAGSFEPAPRLPSAELLGDVPLTGPGYHIGEDTEVVDYYGQFSLRTDVGGLTADGAQVLRLRLRELPAVRALEQVSSARVFGDAVVRGVEKPIEAVRQVTSEPKETASGVPAGIGRFLKRTARNAKELALDINDAARDAMDDDDDDEDKADKDEPTTEERIKKGATSATLRYIGYNKARREIARQVGADPYSTNPLLDERLDKLAWASWSGAKLAGLGVGMIGGIAAQALGLARDAYELVWELPPEDLKRRNLKELAKLDIRGKPARDFVRRGKGFTLTQQTEFVELLRLPLFAPARPALFEQALGSEREVHARFLITAMRMLLAAERVDAPGATAVVVGAAPALRRTDGGHVVALPVDYLHWTADTAEFAWRDDLIGEHNLLLVTGIVSPTALDALSQAGWSVRERVDPERAGEE
jgi:hypothetical protein